MKRLFLSLLVGVVVTSSAVADEATAPIVSGASGIPKHLELARELVATVKPENNLYNATKTQSGVTWKDGVTVTENKVNTMCSGLVGAILHKANSPTFALLKSKTKRTGYMHVNNFVELYEKGLIAHVTTIADVKPGDIFIMKCNDKCATATGIPAQGHVAIVDAVPTKEKSFFSRTGSIEWKLTIIDSDDMLHGSDDTRNVGVFTKVTGVGRGSFAVYTDEAGVPVGYTDGFKRNYHNATDRPIYFARPLEPVETRQ